MKKDSKLTEKVKKSKTWLKRNKKISETRCSRGLSWPSRIGMKHSEKTKRKMRLKKFSKTYRQNMSEAAIRRKIHGMTGKKHSENTKEKIKVARRRQKIPFKDTSIEIILQKELKKEKIRFQTHKSLIGTPDIFIEPNVCIFVDGCYWHCCPTCNIKNMKYKDRQEKDMKNSKELEKHNYIVLRFWEHEIENDITKCLKDIKNYVRKINNDARSSEFGKKHSSKRNN